MEIRTSSLNGITTLEAEIAGKKIIFESGAFAWQANSSCTVRIGDTVVLSTAVMADEPREGADFFPLMVDVEERLYAAGKIKGSRWIKREGRPSDEAITTTRLIDRSLRPLFPGDFFHEVQVIVTVLSVDNENDSDIVGLLAASCALAISDIPWSGPIGGIRLGYIAKQEDSQKEQWIINPTFAEREKSSLDLILSGRENRVLMIEASANEVREEKIMEGIEFGQKFLQETADCISEFAKAMEKKKFQYTAGTQEAADAEDTTADVMAISQKWAETRVPEVLFEKPLLSKSFRREVQTKLEEELKIYLEKEGIGKERRKKTEGIIAEYLERAVSQAILKKGKRVDGRALNEIRPLKAQIGILPRTHGSGLFSRGETQVLSVVTLGTPGDEQMLEGIETNGKKRYMHHYNFPAFSVGETGPIRAPGRREIGHGALAERALLPVLPAKEEFPYIIRVVSEVLSSNGSSSMASVCASTLSLMDAGVPIRRPVAGIAMGLASDSAENYKILTDLQDLEDGEGGMDFKIAGTEVGVTALQLDTKTNGLTTEVCRKAFEQGYLARMQILKVMSDLISAPKSELSPYAPRIIIIKIDPKKIREVIGTGGKVINEIVEKTGVEIEIEQDGTIFVSAVNQEASKKAIEIINDIVRDIKAGEIYEGRVTRILDFGAIVQLTQNKDGMVHISEIAPYRVNRVEDIVKVGDMVKVKVLHVDESGKASLSIKALQEHTGNFTETNGKNREHRGGHGFGRKQRR